MPILNTVQVSKEIRSIMFISDGSITVVLSKFEEGNFLSDENFYIDPIVAATLLDVPTIPGLTLRQQIISTVYQHLIDTNKVVGTISAT